MSEIEKIERYIELTSLDKLPNKTNLAYALDMSGASELSDMAAARNGLDAISMAFQYGRAKGYRMAKAVGKG